MAYSTYIDHGFNVGLFKLTGYVDADQIMAAADDVYHHSEWRPQYVSLWDFRPSREVAITPSGLRDTLKLKYERDADGSLGGKIAGVINRPLIMIFGKIIEVQASTDTSTVKAFKTEKAARQWLGLPGDADLWAPLSG